MNKKPITGIWKIENYKIKFVNSFQWIFEAFDQEGNRVCSKAFVQLSNRPNLLDKELTVTYFNLECTKLNEILLPERLYDINRVVLNSHDGCHNLIERWTLNEACVKEVNFGKLDSSGNKFSKVEIKISYADFDKSFDKRDSDLIDKIRNKRQEIMKSDKSHCERTKEEREFIESPEFQMAIKKIDERVSEKTETGEILNYNFNFDFNLYPESKEDKETLYPKKKKDVNYQSPVTWTPKPRKFEKLELRESNGMFEVWGQIICPLTKIPHWSELTNEERADIDWSSLEIVVKKSCNSPAVGECTSLPTPNVCQDLSRPNLI